MFAPNRDQARQFFVDAWRKHRERLPLTALETAAAELVFQHPEYHSLLEAPDAIEREFRPEEGRINPFLHLSLHLAIHEQLTIDQPPGLRAAFGACLARLSGDRHAALHEVLEVLGEIVFEAQRSGRPPDGAAYVERLLRRAGRRA